MTYTVVILEDGEYTRLECATLEEAQQVRRSFVNYGKCQEITIEQSQVEYYRKHLNCGPSRDWNQIPGLYHYYKGLLNDE